MNNLLSPKEEMLEKAIKALRRENFDVKAKTFKNIGYSNDPEIELEFSFDGKIIKKRFYLEISRFSPSLIGQLVLNQEHSLEKQLLVINYAPPLIAEKLRELNITFIDTSGNAFFNEPEFYFFISSRAKEVEIKLSKPNIIFQSSGLQLLFVLLSIPNSENFTYRKLVEISGISLGSVNEIITSLTREFYLVTRNEKRFLVRKDELLKRWVQGYSETLRPKLLIRRFNSSDLLFEENSLKKLKGCWGGEFAASLMTSYLKPSKFTLFTELPDVMALRIILQQFKLHRELDGQLEVLRRFWKFDEDNTIAPPLLVYADLVASADSRNLEVAKMIYNEYLARLVE